MLATVGLLVVASSCVDPPPPAPLPDPIITCDTLLGPISYSPPATTATQDVTIAAEPGAGLSDCVDNTGIGVAGAEVTASIVMPAPCVPAPGGTTVGTGSVQLWWNDGAVSRMDATLVAVGAPAGGWVLELTVTTGRWVGARGSVSVQVTTSDGDCVSTPVANATIVSREPLVLRPAPPPPLGGLAQIAAGTSHTCALTTAGSVECWGSNEWGQIGNGAISSYPSPGAVETAPVEVVGVDDAVQVTAGDFHSCALIDDGSIRCWGFGGRGELGHGSWASSSTPVTVAGITDATSITQGLAHTCALLPDASATCWGYNLWGSVGDGTTTNRNAPVPVVGLAPAAQLSAGGDTTCALDPSGVARCWGRNGNGQLGDGTTTGRTTPVEVVGLGAVAEIDPGRYHTCALGGDGTVSCWGDDTDGQLGTGGVAPSLTPVEVGGITGVTGLGAGWFHTCATTASGVSCWGGNADGQLGNGTNTLSTTPVGVLDLGPVAEVSSNFHSCVLDPDGGAHCWGRNTTGQLGDGTQLSRNRPVPVLAG